MSGPVSNHPATLPVETLLTACDIRRQRRSGPGGQHRNKVETGIMIRHRPSGVEVGATERRSQEANRQVAIRRLRIALAVHVRCPAAPEDGPSELWRSRCQHGKVVVSTAHEDFPALLAEALDRLRSCDDNLSSAAAILNCTSSQLIRLIRQEPQAFMTVNQYRRARNLHPLR